jgi:hypothetical protein
MMRRDVAKVEAPELERRPATGFSSRAPLNVPHLSVPEVSQPMVKTLRIGREDRFHVPRGVHLSPFTQEVQDLDAGAASDAVGVEHPDASRVSGVAEKFLAHSIDAHIITEPPLREVGDCAIFPVPQRAEECADSPRGKLSRPRDRSIAPAPWPYPPLPTSRWSSQTSGERVPPCLNGEGNGAQIGFDGASLRLILISQFPGAHATGHLASAG